MKLFNLLKVTLKKSEKLPEIRSRVDF